MSPREISRGLMLRVTDPADGPEDVAIRREVQERVARAIGRLAAHEQDFLLWYFGEGQTLTVIGQRLPKHDGHGHVVSLGLSKSRAASFLQEILHKLFVDLRYEA